jgi:hypothetical protein
MIWSLTLSAPEEDLFLELDRTKQLTLDCARSVLGTMEGGFRALSRTTRRRLGCSRPDSSSCKSCCERYTPIWSWMACCSCHSEPCTRFVTWASASSRQASPHSGHCGRHRTRRGRLNSCECCDDSLPAQQTSSTNCSEASSHQRLTVRGLTLSTCSTLGENFSCCCSPEHQRCIPGTVHRHPGYYHSDRRQLCPGL